MTSAVLAVAFADLIGVALLAFALILYQQTEQFMQRAWPAPGVVIGFDGEEGGDAQTAPVVRFETTRGEEQRFRAELYLTWRGYAMGDTVPVLYDPQQPSDARLDDSLLLWVGPLVAAAFGLILILGSTGALAAAVIFASRARVRSAPPLK
jgi:hypothetical protein